MVAAGVCLLLVPVTGQSQSTAADSFPTTIGLQVGALRGETSLHDGLANVSFRVNLRHRYGWWSGGEWSGEAGLSLSTATGKAYRTRLIPLEYRINYHFLPFGGAGRSGGPAGTGAAARSSGPGPGVAGSRSGSTHFPAGSVRPYLYAGVGLLYSRPVEIPSPDDPFTMGGDPTLPSSPLWSYSPSLNPYIPAGAGVDIRLDPSTILSLQAGYNYSLHFLSLHGEGFRHGFWGVTVGLGFLTGRRPAAAPLRPGPAPRFTRARIPVDPVLYPVMELALTTPVEIESDRLSYAELQAIDRKSIYFDVLSAVVKPDGYPVIDEIAGQLERYPGFTLYVSGFSDAAGSNVINDMISESRARAVWLEIIERGIEPHRVGLAAFRDRFPQSDPENYEATQHLDRRVDFQIERGELPGSEQLVPVSSDGMRLQAVSDLGAQAGMPIRGSDRIRFEGQSLELDEEAGDYLLHVYWLLQERPDLELLIHSRPEAGHGPGVRAALIRARADRIRQELILMGIPFDRVRTVLQGDSRMRLIEGFLSNDGRQVNLLVPVQRGGAE